MRTRAVATLFAGLLALGAGSARAGGTLDAIRARGTLRVGTTGDYKPFSFRAPDGSYSGADISMMRLYGTHLGVKVEFVPTVWAKLNQDFAAGMFDIAVGGVTNLPPRAAIAPFSTTTYVDGKRPIARCADRERFTSLSAIDSPETRVVVNPGASNEDFARANFPHAKLTVHADNATVFDEIVAGRADVMVTDGIEVDHQAFLHPELCATHVPGPFTRLEKAYWLQNDPDFVRDLDGWLGREIASGEWQAILEQSLKAP